MSNGGFNYRLDNIKAKRDNKWLTEKPHDPLCSIHVIIAHEFITLQFVLSNKCLELPIHWAIQLSKNAGQIRLSIIES